MTWNGSGIVPGPFFLPGIITIQLDIVRFYDKLYKRLSRKYSGNELEYKVINYLFKKTYRMYNYTTRINEIEKNLISELKKKAPVRVKKLAVTIPVPAAAAKSTKNAACRRIKPRICKVNCCLHALVRQHPRASPWGEAGKNL